MAAAIVMYSVAAPASAQAFWSVTLPDVSDMSRDDAEALIAELARVSVIASNCPKWTVDDPTWALINGTGDQLAMQLGIDPASYDSTYFGPAFALLDDPTACDRVGPEAKPLIARLTSMGGSTSSSRVADGGDTDAGKKTKETSKAASKPSAAAASDDVQAAPAP